MKYPIIRQHSEEDCGAACLATVARYSNRTFAINRIREAVGTGQLGTTLLGLRRGAETLGFNARAVQASPEVLSQIQAVPLPAIIHWQGNHWVVWYGKCRGKHVIGDPAMGIRYLSQRELVEGWRDWTMLLIEPDPIRFYEQPNDKVGGLGRFIGRAWPYRGILIEAFFCALAVGLLSLALPFLLQILTDDVLVRGDMKLLNVVVIAVVAMNIISSSLILVQSNLIAQFAQRLELGLVLEFGRKLLHLPLGYYEARRSGEVISRLQDIQEINQLILQVVVGLPSQFFIAVVSFSLMLFYSVKLTIAAVCIAILMTLSTVAFLPALQQKIQKVLILDAENQGVLVESFKGALTLKTTTAAPQFWEEFQARFGRVSNLNLRANQIGIFNNTFSGLASGIGSVCLLWLGSSFVIKQELSIGQLLAFSAMNANFLALIGTVIGLVEEFTRVKTATQRLTEVIDATPEVQDKIQKPNVKLPDDAGIICTNLSFHYPGRIELLDNFSLKLRGGQVIAVIGRSGCGKSTLAKLIAGLYPIKSGNVRIGLYNLDDLSLDSLRQQVVLVPQEAHFWSRSIIENFRLGAPQITFEEIVRACHVTDADEFISKLPDKYQTVLGEFGSNLSGGQRQRLAIARALVTNPPILILDESTSGLDPVSEANVLDRLLDYRKGKTTILISHRPSVIIRSDWVVLLEQGRLKLEGSIENLQSTAGEHLSFMTSEPLIR